MKKLLIFIMIASLVVSFCTASFNETKCDSETFDGEAREKAKLTIGTQPTEQMTVSQFLNEFAGDPGLTDNSPRSTKEQRNVTVTAWLYTYVREGDEDFHLILGSTDKVVGRKFMTAEISGLPKDKTSSSYNKLKIARDDFKKIILNGDDYCSGFTQRLLKKPIKVIVTGSVFYDTHHPNGGSGTGKFKSKSSWEIHPVTSFSLAE